MNNPRVLPRRHVRLCPEAAGEQVASLPAGNLGKPGLDRGSGLLGDFELNRLARLLLDKGSAVSNPAAGTYIVSLQPHEIASLEFAIDGEVKHRQVAGSVLQLKLDPYGPHVLGLQRLLLTDEPALVPRTTPRCRALVFIELLPNDHALPVPVWERPAENSIAKGRSASESRSSVDPDQSSLDRRFRGSVGGAGAFAR